MSISFMKMKYSPLYLYIGAIQSRVSMFPLTAKLRFMKLFIGLYPDDLGIDFLKFAIMSCIFYGLL